MPERKTRPNQDSDTGIHYGVISIGDLDTAWFDESTPMYADTIVAGGTEEPCFEEVEPAGHVLIRYGDSEGIEFYAEQVGDSPYVMVTKSPYVRFCRYASPCYPGAGELSTEGSIETYSFPPHFYREFFGETYRLSSYRLVKAVTDSW